MYIGWDKSLSQLQVHEAMISATGSSENDSVIVDFIEFEGQGLPGYSGGPVFNTDGKIIAIMREGWKKQGVKGGKVSLINRAFSIEILSILDKEIHSTESSKKGKPVNIDSLKKLIDIKTK